MPDFTMCSDNECPMKETCKRNPASGTEPSDWQPWVRFNREGLACNYYWSKKMLSNEKILEIAEDVAKLPPEMVLDVFRHELLDFARAIEAECRLPKIEGLKYALDSVCNAPLAYEFRVLRDAACAYEEASREG